MKEIITLGIGQCGVQTSSAAWELYCIEHGIAGDGKMLPCSQPETDISYLTFFQSLKNDRACPRTILADLEATVIDEIRAGAYRQLFHPESLISGYEDAANNYARGRFTQGKTQVNRIMEQVRKQAANCDCLEGFLLLRGTGGGTGAGLGDIISEKIDAEYGKRTKIESGIYPGTKYSTAVVEPYNCIMTAHSAHEHTDVVLQFDNEAMYEICKNHLHIPRPSYNNLNRILTQVLSSVTCSLRFENYVDASLMQVQTNLVPFPKIHYLIPSYSPFFMTGKGIHKKVTVDEITKEVFHPSSHLTTCDFTEGKFMAVVLQYRGHCSVQGVNQAVNVVKQREEMQFVDWCPTGFKMGICTQPSINAPGSLMGNSERSVSCLSNHTAMGSLLKVISQKFDLLFSKRSFVHWYVGEGMEEGEFAEAKEFIHKLCRDYEECGMSTEEFGEEGCTVSASKSPQSKRNVRRPEGAKSPEMKKNYVAPKSPTGNINAVTYEAPKRTHTSPERVKTADTKPAPVNKENVSQNEEEPAQMKAPEKDSPQNSPMEEKQASMIDNESEQILAHQESSPGGADKNAEYDSPVVEEKRGLTPADDVEQAEDVQRIETGQEETPMDSQPLTPSENLNISEEPVAADTEDADNDAYRVNYEEEPKPTETETDEMDIEEDGQTPAETEEKSKHSLEGEEGTGAEGEENEGGTDEDEDSEKAGK
jgi:tubulin alpha